MVSLNPKPLKNPCFDRQIAEALDVVRSPRLLVDRLVELLLDPTHQVHPCHLVVLKGDWRREHTEAIASQGVVVMQGPK